jgi:hypothetical protein
MIRSARFGTLILDPIHNRVLIPSSQRAKEQGLLFRRCVRPILKTGRPAT